MRQPVDVRRVRSSRRPPRRGAHSSLPPLARSSPSGRRRVGTAVRHARARGSRCAARSGRSAPSPTARCGRAPASGRGRGTGSARAAARRTPALAGRSSRQLAVLAARLAREHPLERPEQVDRGEDHADRADRPRTAVDDERADERRGTRRRSRRSRAGRSTRTRPRRTARRGSAPTFQSPPNSPISQRVPAVVEHPDEEEQRAGGEPVADHREDAALDALRREGEDAEHHEAHVRDRRVRDQPFQVRSASRRRSRRR